MYQLRLFSLVNFYISQIQAGIQTAHIVHELFNKYPESTDQGAMLRDWSLNHKTIIVLNAGADPQIQELVEEFRMSYEFPWVEFFEDEGLCNARTACGIILPECIYDAQKRFPYYWYGKEHSYGTYEEKVYAPGDKYFALIELIKSKRLA